MELLEYREEPCSPQSSVSVSVHSAGRAESRKWHKHDIVTHHSQRSPDAEKHELLDELAHALKIGCVMTWRHCRKHFSPPCFPSVLPKKIPGLPCSQILVS